MEMLFSKVDPYETQAAIDEKLLLSILLAMDAKKEL